MFDHHQQKNSNGMGAWKKTPSDIWEIARLFEQIAFSYFFLRKTENWTLVFFHSPLQLAFLIMSSNKSTRVYVIWISQEWLQITYYM